MAVLLFPMGSLARETSSLKPIIIHGDKDTPQVDPHGASTVIHTEVYKDRPVSLPEVLAEQSGIHLTRYGGLEDHTSISIRGSSAEELTILYDGIPLEGVRGGDVNLAPLDLDSLDTIAVYRGSSPLHYGFFPAAGLVELESATPKKGVKAGASVGYGSFNTVKAHTSFSRGKNHFSWLGSFNISRTEGDFTFLDDNGTPVNTADDARVKRANNASQSMHPFLKLAYDFDGKTRAQWLSHVIREDRGVPGFASNQSSIANVDHTQWLNAFKLTRDQFFSPHLNFESQSYFKWAKSQFSDLNAEIGLGGAQDNDDTSHTLGQKFLGEYFWGDHQIVNAFFLYQFERFHPHNFLSPPGTASLRHRWNTGVGDEISLWSNRLMVTPAVWVENIHNQINNDDPSFVNRGNFVNAKAHHRFSAKMGATGMVASWLHLEGHVSRHYRFPTFPELFGDRGGVVGNPFLNPQESLNGDIGLLISRAGDGKLPQARLKASYFHRSIDDLIQFQQNAAGFARAENVGKAKIQGVEAHASIKALGHMALTANYTFQKAYDHANNPGRRVPGRPTHEMYSRVEGWMEKGRIFFAAQWMDENFLDALNTRVVRNRTLLSSGVTYQPFRDWSLSLEGKNLGNIQIVDVVGFPLPGRSVWGKVTYSMDHGVKKLP